MDRRRALVGVGLALGAVLPGLAAPRRVPVSLRKFEIVPVSVRVAVGESVVLALASSDFVHGFAIPELGLRVDVPPGRVVELAVPAQPSAGRYTILCDNFCGENHDKMMGGLQVG